MDRPNLLQDIINRLETTRQGLFQTVEPFSQEQLNYKPGGTAATVRQLLNHLWATEAWMMERVSRALKGEPDITKEEAEKQMPDVLDVPMKGLLIHLKDLAEIDVNEDIQAIFARFNAVRGQTRDMLSSLKPDDVYKKLTRPTDDDKTVREILNHTQGHELLHIGAILNIRGIMERK